MDDVKISYKSEEVITNIIKKVENKFGPLSVSRGKSNTFLGMNFTLNDNGTVSINMHEYKQEAIDVFGEDVSAPVKI